jgi:ActR/RegA family two-component response regulator
MNLVVTAPMETIWRTPECVCAGLEKKIVLADDDVYAVGATGLAFSDAGFSIRTACTGLDAVNIAAKWWPAAVVLDLHMPLGDGWDGPFGITIPRSFLWH